MQYSELRKWLKNLSRTIVLSSAVVISITFYYYLPNILGLTGVLFGTIVVLMVPALIHNKLIARSFWDRFFNYFILIYGILVAIIISFFLIYFWGGKDKKKGE